MLRTMAMPLAAVMLAATMGASPALAADEAALEELREQFRQLKDHYEKRISALEQRLQQAERTATRQETVAAAAAEQAVPAASERSAATPYNPAVSLILNGTYGNLSRDPSDYRINGFVPGGGEVGPPARGFSLGESELVFSAAIDPYFRGSLIAALGADERIGVEEGFIETLGLGGGATLKAGRFLSAVGYHNEIHAHAWDFADAPLAYKSFLGNHFADDGVQLKWVAPTDLYVDMGMELGRGRAFPSGPAGGRSKNGSGSSTWFAHVGGDIGASTAWKLGVAHLRTSPRNRSYDDMDASGTSVSNAFSGRSRLWTFGGVLKWAPGGNATVTHFKLQGEYFRRGEQGSLAYDTASASLGRQSDAYASRQSGWYAQGVYQFMPQWRIGYRRDQLNPGAASLRLMDSGALAAADFPILAAYKPTRNTLMLDWSGSEFSRVRLQAARDRSRSNGSDNQLFVQYIMSLGAHGAHSF